MLHILLHILYYTYYIIIIHGMIFCSMNFFLLSSFLVLRFFFIQIYKWHSLAQGRVSQRKKCKCSNFKFPNAILKLLEEAKPSHSFNFIAL